MTWNALELIPRQWTNAAGNPLSGYWLIAFLAGTTTRTNMAINAAGSGSVAKFQTNSLGYLVTSGGTIIRPHVDREVKLALVPTETEADASNISNAVWPTVDNVKGFGFGYSTTVDTLAALKALDTATYTSASTLGYTAAGDGGHGQYRYNSGSSASADNFLVIQPDVGSGRWELLVEDVYNVKLAGADSTGAVSAVTIFNTVLALALTNNKTMSIPAGSYKLDSVWTLSSSGTPYLSGVRIKGAGQRQTILSCTGTGYVRSNQTQVNDNIYMSDLSIVNTSSSATRGLDIGTVRDSLFENIDVRLFPTGFGVRVNQGVANWWNRFYNCEAWSTSAAGSIGWELGNDGLVATGTGLAIIPDLDYNDFYGCKAFSCETAVKAYNVIGCLISGFQATDHTTMLKLYAGNNNEIEMVAESVTDMGFASAGTLANTLSLYNDGAISTAFVDSGLNRIEGQILGQPSLPNSLSALDCFMQDRLYVSFIAATKSLFSITFTSVEVAATVTITTCGYIVATSEFASVQVFDVTRTAGGAYTITSVRATGTAGVITAAAGASVVTFTIAGHAVAQTIAQSVIQVQGIGVVQAYPYMQSLNYDRL